MISIIGMLSSIVMVSLNSARAKARNANRIATVSQLQTAFAIAYTGAALPNTGGTYACLSTTCPWGYSHIAAVDNYLASYIKFSPDPNGGKTYYGILFYGPTTGSWTPYPADPAGAHYIYWSVERAGDATAACAPGLVSYDQASVYPNDIFCVLKVQ